MTHFQPGDRVRVVRHIEDATVTDVNLGGMTPSIDVMWPGLAISEVIDLDDSTYTVTKLAPQPQLGEVWEWPSGTRRHILQDDEGDLHAVLPANPDDYDLIGEVDFTHARCVYQPERATPTVLPPAPTNGSNDAPPRDGEREGEWLRRIASPYGDELTETSPGSGRYWRKGCCTWTREALESRDGTLTDLPSVRVGEEGTA
jgi:hypothetical protein